MKDAIKDILAKIEALNLELKGEYDRLAEKYGFHFQKRKIIFLEEIRKRNKAFRFPSWKYLIPQMKYLRFLLSMPFIYGMLIPTVILDICLTIYQWTAFPLYGIPRVKRTDYIIYERRFLDYLNWIQKLNCLYCSYVNGLYAYAVEIAGRTERYWCPIKAAHNPHFSHSWYPEFADYGNPEQWREKFTHESEAFQREEKCFTNRL